MATLPDEIRVRFVYDSLPTGVLIELDGRPVTDPEDAYSLDDANQGDHDVVMRSSMITVEAVLNALGYRLDERLGYTDGDLTMLRFFRRKGSDHRSLNPSVGDPFGLLTDEQNERLHDDLAGMARQRRRAEDEAGGISMP